MRILLKHTANFGDIEITDGIITSLHEPRSTSDEEIDCSNQLAWPGLVDSHVHFRTPGQEYKEDWSTGSAAALAGGITSVLDMPNNVPPTTTASRLHAKRKLISNKARVQYRLAIGAINNAIDDLIEAEKEADVIKLDLGATTGNVSTTEYDDIERVFKETTKLLMIHAEDHSIILENEHGYRETDAPDIHSAIRGREAAIAAVQDVLALAKQYKREIYICHVSTLEEIELIKQARTEGVAVHAEVTPHHLFLNTSAYKTHGNFVKVNPPLREPEDNEALWQAIRDGVVTTIASDHAPHTIQEKQESYWNAPSGIPGIELLLPLLLTAAHEGKISLEDIQRCCIINPAALFGFTKEIKIGSPADIVVIDPTASWVVEKHLLHTKCGWSPFDGYRMQGKVTFSYTNQ